MAKFEVVSKYADKDIQLPIRATAHSAGYDLSAAEDIIIPSFLSKYNDVFLMTATPRTMSEAADTIKKLGLKPTLVSTGLRCKLANNEYLGLVARSSLPLKHLLIVANGEAIIDADYYNADNEGEIFLQLINLAPFPIKIEKGTRICQGIIHNFNITEDDCANGVRKGGLGSTSNG